MSSPDNKRKLPRIPVELWIEVSSQGELYFQRASNLSVGGAYFTQTFPLPVGTKVELKFELPGQSGEISCNGEIVTAQDLGMGVRFLNLVSADEQRIEALIQKIAAEK